RILRDVSGSVERDKVEGTVDEYAANLSVTTEHSDFAAAGLVIEAVPEDYDLKVSSLQAVEAHLGQDAFLATNTSSMSVNGLAKELQRPQNGSVAKIVKLEHAWRRLDGRNDDGFQVAPFPG